MTFAQSRPRRGKKNLLEEITAEENVILKQGVVHKLRHKELGDVKFSILIGREGW